MYNHGKATTYCTVLLYLPHVDTLISPKDLFVVITLDSPGPPHQAATWIRLNCLAPFASDVIYSWTFHCTHRGSMPLESSPPLDTLGNHAAISLRSTPRICFDTAVCTASDTDTGATGQATWIVGPVTGKEKKNYVLPSQCHHGFMITNNQ